MEEQEEILLKKLEEEGKQIAKYRMQLSHLTNSGKKINRSKLLGICDHLNKHIGSFDRINAELSRLETVG